MVCTHQAQRQRDRRETSGQPERYPKGRYPAEATAGNDRSEIELHIGVRARQIEDGRFERCQRQRRQQAKGDAEEREQRHRRAHRPGCFARALGASAAREREKRDAERPDKTRRGEAARERQRGDTERENKLTCARKSESSAAATWKVSHSLIKPLNGGSAAIASEPIKNKDRRLRHTLNQSAQLFDIARMRCVQTPRPRP